MTEAVAQEDESPVGAAAARADARPRQALAIGTPCPNCATSLAGRWCHGCGQSAEEFHRSLVRLGAEAFQGLVDIDGRLWRTLPDLCFRPGRLTRLYLDGHRAPQIPPFRLFLTVIVLLFLVAGLPLHGKSNIELNPQNSEIQTTPNTSVRIVPIGGDKANAWIRAHLAQAAKNPDAFVSTMMAWAQRLAVLTLPISALLLGAMFFWRRELYLFDHLIFSMHSLSFQGLLVSLVMLGAAVSDWVLWLLLAVPAHLFVHLRGTYGIGVFGTLLRMAVLFVGSFAVLTVALSVLVFIGLTGVSA